MTDRAGPVCYLDSNLFMTAFEVSPSNETAPARALFHALRNAPFLGSTSEFTMAELLSSPNSETVSRGAQRFYTALLVDERFIALQAVTLSRLLLAAEIRRQNRQKLPDAIHLATALDTRCRFFVSADRDMRNIPPSLTWVKPDAAGIATVLKALDA